MGFMGGTGASAPVAVQSKGGGSGASAPIQGGGDPEPVLRFECGDSEPVLQKESWDSRNDRLRVTGIPEMTVGGFLGFQK